MRHDRRASGLAALEKASELAICLSLNMKPTGAIRRKFNTSAFCAIAPQAAAASPTRGG
jgi:hypothetical protein